MVIFVSYTSSASGIRISTAREDGLRHRCGGLRLIINKYMVKIRLSMMFFESDDFRNRTWGAREERG